MIKGVLKNGYCGRIIAAISVLFSGSLSIVGVVFFKIPPQFYEKGPFYVSVQDLLILGMPNKPPHDRPFYPMMYSEVSGFGTV